MCFCLFVGNLKFSGYLYVCTLNALSSDNQHWYSNVYECLHQDSSDSVMPHLSQKQFTKLNSDHLGMWGRRKYELQLSLRFGRLPESCEIFAIKLRLRTVIKSSGEGSKSPKQRSKSKSKTLDVVFLLLS